MEINAAKDEKNGAKTRFSHAGRFESDALVAITRNTCQTSNQIRSLVAWRGTTYFKLNHSNTIVSIMCTTYKTIAGLTPALSTHITHRHFLQGRL